MIAKNKDGRKTVTKKILPKYFDDIVRNGKRFELRKDDDNVQPGDFLILKEWDGEQYTGQRMKWCVSYVLRNVPEYGLKDGYCIIGLGTRLYLPGDKL